MPHPFPFATSWAGGMRRDVDRAMLPSGSSWNLLDFIPDELGAPVAGRGGWGYAGSTLAGATSIKAVAYAPFSAGAKLLAIDQQPKLWDVVNATSITGTPTIPGGPPTYHRGKLIIPNSDGTTAITYYDGTTLGNLAGSPPAGQLADVYKDHTALAKSAANRNRLWFSAAGDPTSWDTSNGYIDTTGDIVAIGSLLNAILVFHADNIERIRGTVPPPGSDMVLEPFRSFGCIDPFSIARWQNNIVFASPEGIYMTDGAGAVDLTAVAQMKTYWQTALTGYASSWRVTGGIYRDHYICSINNGSTLVDCFCVNLAARTIWRFTNLHANGLVQVKTATKEETYMGLANAGRVGQLSSLWSPSATVKNDADGTTPTPIWESAAHQGWDRLHRRWIMSMGQQKWRWVYLDHDLRADTGDAPTFTVSYGKTPTGAYTATSATVPAATDATRVRRSLSSTSGGAIRSQMLTLKVAVTGPYTKAAVKAVEGVFEPIEIGAL